MQLAITRTPNTVEKCILHSVSHLFRYWVKRGRNLLFWAVPQDAIFDYDFTVLEQGKPYSGNLKFGIDYQVFFSQPYEPQNAQILTTIATCLAQFRRSVHFIDVGANVGFTSNLMLGKVDSIHSFEPHPKIFQSLLAKWNNYADHTWQIHPFGLGAQEIELAYYEPASHNTGTGSFVAGASWNQNIPIALPIRKGDQVLTELEVSEVALIKIDVEGFEPFVLQGLSETLKRDRPVILMELSTLTDQILKEHNLSLQALLYEDAIAVAIHPQAHGKFQLEVQDFSQLESRHQDILILPAEQAKVILEQFESLR